MKIKYLRDFACISILLLYSCDKSFEDLTQNENVPKAVPASSLFNSILNQMKDLPSTKNEIYSQYYIYNYDYYGNNRYDDYAKGGTNYYNSLINVDSMEKRSLLTGGAAINPYTALGKFFRAYFFSKMSLEQGDIPMKQALQGKDNLNPQYDSQKDIMIQSLKWLEESNEELAKLIANPNIAGSGIGANLSNDIYLNNDLKKWQKVVNTFRIRLLIALSKKSGELDIKTQFAAILQNQNKYPIMSSAVENLQYQFVTPNNLYPQNPNIFGQFGSRQNLSSTYVGLLTKLKDPRVFVTAEPARYLTDKLHKSPTSFESFVGADAGLDLGEMYEKATLQYYSFLNRKHFYSTYVGEPCIQIGYPELMFNIAEGINRGWVTGNAESYYIKGIQASFESYGIPTTAGENKLTAYFFRPGSIKGPSDPTSYDIFQIPVNWNTYYSQEPVKYTEGEKGLTQILQQKYLTLFRHSGLESYFNFRRTGIPKFSTGSGTGNSGRIPLRFAYPATERTTNTKNYNDAIEKQFGAKDDINAAMWIIK